MLVLDNIFDRETVHQRCLLITGRCEGNSGSDGHVEIAVKDESGRATFPEQRWPLSSGSSHGYFKALAILAPGENLIRVTSTQNKIHATEIRIQYVPLLQTPPLHLAIMVAKDSPLLIDCPPSKFGSLSGAHSSLDAAISKFRVAAYMWQALTAEEMRSNGLERRSFRLEEEWASDTMSFTFADDKTTQSTAKIHLIRADKTVAELRDAQIAQQNPSARRRDELHAIFTQALLAHGAPFTKETQPVVAGMILDSHYDTKTEMIVAHAALGAHDPNGLSLGIFGSHLTYSWPRFMEEIPDCLLDTTQPGDRVGNDNGECASMWEACSIGQGAFLHEVGHAFSAPHTTGIMSRGYSKDWPKCFLSKTAYSVKAQTGGISPVTEATPNDCHWDVRDLLRFRSLPHFRRPSDTNLSLDPPSIELEDDDEDFLRIVVTSEVGIAKVIIDGHEEAGPSVARPVKSIRYTLDELEGRFDPKTPLSLEVVAMNGKSRVMDVWKLFKRQEYIRIPGSGLRLKKAGVACEEARDDDWSWTVMLKKRSHDGSLVDANKIDIRVGCGLDGAIVYYRDGSSIPCGPRGREGSQHGMGGHQAKKMRIPRGVEIAKVAVTQTGNWGLDGLRMMLSNGSARGALNKRHGGTTHVLAPGKNHKVIGFFGTSGAHGMCREFGIVTAPRDQEIPDSIYDLPELQNNPTRRAAKRQRIGSRRDSQATLDDGDDTSEDSDDGYDQEEDNDDF